MSNKNGEKRKTLGQCGYRKNDEFYLQKENPKSRMIARLLLNFGEANVCPHSIHHDYDEMHPLYRVILPRWKQYRFRFLSPRLFCMFAIGNFLHIPTVFRFREKNVSGKSSLF